MRRPTTSPRSGSADARIATMMVIFAVEMAYARPEWSAVLEGFVPRAEMKYGFASWEAKSFGPLDPARMLRIAIPGVTALILGLQTLLSSFFLSILGLRRR